MKHLLFIIFLPMILFGQSTGLERLMKGNQRFINNELDHPNRSLERRQEQAAAQTPFAIIVTCADSRLSPEIIFDQGIGDLFVLRVAGNVISPYSLESIKFGVYALGASTIVVMGHEACGAVNAVVTGNAQDIPDIALLIEPSVKKANGNLKESIKENALNMKQFLTKIPFLQEKKVDIQAAYYDLNSGEVKILQ